MATAQAEATSNTISLSGSAAMVTEFFGYSINSILFQRGIYDPEKFTTIKKYGLRMQVATDEGMTSYLEKVLAQIMGIALTFLSGFSLSLLLSVCICVCLLIGPLLSFLLLGRVIYDQQPNSVAGRR